MQVVRTGRNRNRVKGTTAPAIVLNLNGNNNSNNNSNISSPSLLSSPSTLSSAAFRNTTTSSSTVLSELGMELKLLEKKRISAQRMLATEVNRLKTGNNGNEKQMVEEEVDDADGLEDRLEGGEDHHLDVDVLRSAALSSAARHKRGSISRPLNHSASTLSYHPSQGYISNTYNLVTCGAFANHSSGLKQGGMNKMMIGLQEQQSKYELELVNILEQRKVVGTNTNTNNNTNNITLNINNTNTNSNNTTSTTAKDTTNTSGTTITVTPTTESNKETEKKQHPLNITNSPRFDSAVDLFKQLVHQQWLSQQRQQVLFSQAITAITTTFVTDLLSSLTNHDKWQRISKIGYLIQVESLLSTFSNENNMLSDCFHAVKMLENIRFAVIQAKPVSNVSSNSTSSTASSIASLVTAGAAVAAASAASLQSGVPFPPGQTSYIPNPTLLEMNGVKVRLRVGNTTRYPSMSLPLTTPLGSKTKGLQKQLERWSGTWNIGSYMYRLFSQGLYHSNGGMQQRSTTAAAGVTKLSASPRAKGAQSSATESVPPFGSSSLFNSSSTSSSGSIGVSHTPCILVLVVELAPHLYSQLPFTWRLSTESLSSASSQAASPAVSPTASRVASRVGSRTVSPRSQSPVDGDSVTVISASGDRGPTTEGTNAFLSVNGASPRIQGTKGSFTFVAASSSAAASSPAGSTGAVVSPLALRIPPAPSSGSSSPTSSRENQKSSLSAAASRLAAKTSLNSTLPIPVSPASSSAISSPGRSHSPSDFGLIGSSGGISPSAALRNKESGLQLLGTRAKGADGGSSLIEAKKNGMVGATAMMQAKGGITIGVLPGAPVIGTILSTSPTATASSPSLFPPSVVTSSASSAAPPSPGISGVAPPDSSSSDMVGDDDDEDEAVDAPWIPLLPILMTQGVNEMQSVANTLGATEIQTEINAYGYRLLHSYYIDYAKYMKTKQKYQDRSLEQTGNGLTIGNTVRNGTVSMTTFFSPPSSHILSSHSPLSPNSPLSPGSPTLSASSSFTSVPSLSSSSSAYSISSSALLESHLSSILEDLTAIDSILRRSSTDKSLHLLFLLSDVVRSLSGSRVVCCKSAKDRTSMSVTLEQTRQLVEEHGLNEREVNIALNLMRLEGVRRMNVMKNTGQFAYAFNKLQRSMLPGLFRPPELACSSAADS